MKKVFAVMALITVVLFGVFAESTITVGAGAHGKFQSDLYYIGPAIKLFTKSGNTFNDLTVESPMWIKNIKSFDDVEKFIEDFNLDDSDLKFLQIINASETFGLALNFLGQDGGALALTLGVGGNVSMDGMFIDADNRLMEFKAGAGAEVYLGINIVKPLSIVVGVSANYPLFGLKVIKNAGVTTTQSYTIDDSQIHAVAHVGVGLVF
jgi:hypothetical protein